MALVLKYATGTQLAAAFRERFRNSTREECARLATWLLARIADGTWTDTQVRNAFGLTAGQYTTLKAKMQTLADHWAAVQAAQGE
jgi:hypothetical protein